MAKRIRLMADYAAYPLWWGEPDLVGNIDPSTLPLSTETIARLMEWSARYDATLNKDDPAASGFPTDEEQRAFEDAGLELWRWVREELGAAYDVWYFSDRYQRLFSHPDELEAMMASSSGE
ncbi:MAG: hypothetical protein C0183_03975 [Roseiflexus castenholzii]|nr:MAG: hypothetical protein C0183_03975 [Roseiflexus castenholzii]